MSLVRILGWFGHRMVGLGTCKGFEWIKNDKDRLVWIRLSCSIYRPLIWFGWSTGIEGSQSQDGYECLVRKLEIAKGLRLGHTGYLMLKLDY